MAVFLSDLDKDFKGCAPEFRPHRWFRDYQEHPDRERDWSLGSLLDAQKDFHLLTLRDVRDGQAEGARHNAEQLWRIGRDLCRRWRSAQCEQAQQYVNQLREAA